MLAALLPMQPLILEAARRRRLPSGLMRFVLGVRADPVVEEGYR
jgi:hypothetical protein